MKNSRLFSAIAANKRNGDLGNHYSKEQCSLTAMPSFAPFYLCNGIFDCPREVKYTREYDCSRSPRAARAMLSPKIAVDKEKDLDIIKIKVIRIILVFMGRALCLNTKRRY